MILQVTRKVPPVVNGLIGNLEITQNFTKFVKQKRSDAIVQLLLKLQT